MKLTWWYVSLLVAAFATTSALFVAQRKPAPVLTGNEKVSLLGQVIHQGNYAWREGLTLEDLVMQAGGFQPFAAVRRIKVVDSTTSESLLHKLHSAVYDLVAPLDKPINEAWEFCSLPWSPPDFDWLRPGPVAKAVIDFRSPRSQYHLQPGDMVFVDERLLNL